ncbi:MAG: hypothetical protein HY905_02395 [Deltaproteobacteria bacterium]|nr:hypothetical protein [Deltaproteobacteria bacterium]
MTKTPHAAAALLIALLGAKAEATPDVLCSHLGPHVSNDGLELSAFTVEGEKVLVVEDTALVSFVIRNVGDAPVKFGPDGVYVTASGPQGILTTQGHIAAELQLAPNAIVTFSYAVSFQMSGVWRIHPGYQLSTPTGYHMAPADWPSCAIQVVDASPTVVTVTQDPSNPRLGDQIDYNVTAVDADGVAWVQIWIDNVETRACKGGSCRFRTRPVTVAPSLGILAMDGHGVFTVSGVLKEWWDPLDSDGDTVRDLGDNCDDVPNADQSDADEDYVGDVCDECDLFQVCPFPVSRRDMVDTCFGSRSVYDYDLEGMHYHDFYDLIAFDGCGCYDTDRGWNAFEAGSVLGEETTCRDIHVVGHESLRTAFSSCPSGLGDPFYTDTGTDLCIGDVLIEKACTEHGPEQRWIDCPAGCDGSACRCPDTDGGPDYYRRGELEGYTDQCLYDGRLREYTCDGIDDEGGIIVGHEDVRCPFGCDYFAGACSCTDSDHGPDPEVPGVVGTFIDHCEGDGRTLVEYYTEVDAFGDCRVRSTPIACEGLCDPVGFCREPSCTDGLLNGGEVVVDCGGTCGACPSSTVRGTIVYEDQDICGFSSGTKPSRYTNFKVIGWGDSRERASWGPYATDSRGYFNLEIPRRDDVTHLCVMVGRWDSGDGGYNYAASILHDMDYCDEYEWYVSSCITVGDVVNFGELEATLDGATGDFVSFWQEQSHDCLWGVCVCGGGLNHRAASSDCFNIANTALAARMFADGDRDPREDDGMASAWIEYPDSHPGSGGDFCYSDCSPDRIRIASSNGFSDYTVAHEYGHHLQHTIGSWDLSVGDMTHTLCTYHDEEFGWCEGFAGFFSRLVAVQAPGVIDGNAVSGCRLEGPRCSEDACDGVFGSCPDGSVYMPESCCDSLNWGGEGTTEGVLWDVVDGGAAFPYSVADDNLAYLSGLVMQVFDRELDDPFDEATPADAPDIRDFGRAMCGRLETWSDRLALTAILGSYSVGVVCPLD